MTQVDQVYRCEICGNVVRVLENGGGELVCCGQPMSLKNETATQENPTDNVVETETAPEEAPETEETTPAEEAETSSESEE